MKILYALLFVVLLSGFYMLYRNELVFRVRMRIAQEIYEISTKQIKAGEKVDRTFQEAFEKYSYNKMVFQLLKFKWTLEEIRRG